MSSASISYTSFMCYQFGFVIQCALYVAMLSLNVILGGPLPPFLIRSVPKLKMLNVKCNFITLLPYCLIELPLSEFICSLNCLREHWSILIAFDKCAVKIECSPQLQRIPLQMNFDNAGWLLILLLISFNFIFRRRTESANIIQHGRRGILAFYV